MKRNGFFLSAVFFVITLAVVVLASPPRAYAAELIMFQAEGCSYCERWHEEIGIIYDKTDEAQTLPIRMVDIDDPRPDDLKPIKGIVYTPTFVVLDQGREVGRIIGYPGEEFFWPRLGEIIKKIEPNVADSS